MSIYEKLLKIQQEVKAPKDMRNDFGKFNYRSAEAIYEVVKPICLKHGALLHITDEIEVKCDRPYIKAIAELIDTDKSKVEDGEIISIGSVGWARIPEALKGMNDCQVSGSASSYARKYAVSALFLLDDNKDPDSVDNKHNGEKEKAMQENQKRLDEMENWRYISADHIEVKAKTKDGGYEWKNIDELTLKALEFLRDDVRFEGIKQDIEKRIELIKTGGK